MARSKSDVGLYGALFVYAFVIAYLMYTKAMRHFVLGAGATFILYAVTGDLVGALLTGAIIALVWAYMDPKHEGFQDAEKPKVPAPDHADRPAEMFQLGKKYKMPATEEDDKEFHLDAGTTFMNAYKSLKPDQIAAMTKDTQELMETQKQLMGTLQTLKPLIQDGKQMMEMFQSYFGAANPTTV